MREITLESLTDEQLQSEAQLLINMLRTKYPKLDLRKGTALRDLLVDTDAAVGTMFSEQANEQRLSASLYALAQRNISGETVDAEDVNAILSNFNMVSNTGTTAMGSIQVFVNNSYNHVLLKGAKFKTSTGLVFTSTRDITASLSPSGEQVKLYQGVSNYWYLVPVEADAVGSEGNISQGTTFESVSTVPDFISAEAFTSFSRGTDLDTLATTVSQIKTSLSVRALTSKISTEALLRDRYDETENPIIAVSLCGYGNRAQLRDKHNLFGVAVGGRVDVYVRNFTSIPVTSDIIKFGTITAIHTDADGNPTGTGDLEFTVDHSEAPGLISLYSVSDADTKVLSSYRYTVSYTATITDTWHDIRVDDDKFGPNAYEATNTIWRNAVVKVLGVPLTSEDISANGKYLKVIFTYLPKAKEIQELVDDGLVRNEGSDYVVRGPMLVHVGLKADVRYKLSSGFDTESAISLLCNYVNNLGFVGRLTRSEIVSILTYLGAVSVDLFDEDTMLYGYVYDAKGVKHELSGDALDLANVDTPDAMLTKDTAVFVLEPKNVQINTIAVD